MIYQMLIFFKKNSFSLSRDDPKTFILLWRYKKHTGLLIFHSLKQKKLIFNFFVNRNWKKLTDSRKRAKILADNRKSHHPIETLLWPSNLTNPVPILRTFQPSDDSINDDLPRMSLWNQSLPTVQLWSERHERSAWVFFYKPIIFCLLCIQISYMFL